MPTYYGGMEASVLAQVQVQVQVQVEIADMPEIMAGVISYSEDSRWDVDPEAGVCCQKAFGCCNLIKHVPR